MEKGLEGRAVDSDSQNEAAQFTRLKDIAMGFTSRHKETQFVSDEKVWSAYVDDVQAREPELATNLEVQRAILLPMLTTRVQIAPDSQGSSISGPERGRSVMICKRLVEKFTSQHPETAHDSEDKLWDAFCDYVQSNSPQHASTIKENRSIALISLTSRLQIAPDSQGSSISGPERSRDIMICERLVEKFSSKESGTEFTSEKELWTAFSKYIQAQSPKHAKVAQKNEAWVKQLLRKQFGNLDQEAEKNRSALEQKLNAALVLPGFDDPNLVLFEKFEAYMMQKVSPLLETCSDEVMKKDLQQTMEMKIKSLHQAWKAAFEKQGTAATKNATTATQTTQFTTEQSMVAATGVRQASVADTPTVLEEIDSPAVMEAILAGDEQAIEAVREKTGTKLNAAQIAEIVKGVEKGEWAQGMTAEEVFEGIRRRDELKNEVTDVQKGDDSGGSGEMRGSINENVSKTVIQTVGDLDEGEYQQVKKQVKGSSLTKEEPGGTGILTTLFENENTRRKLRRHDATIEADINPALRRIMGTDTNEMLDAVSRGDLRDSAVDDVLVDTTDDSESAAEEESSTPIDAVDAPVQGAKPVAEEESSTPEGSTVFARVVEKRRKEKQKEKRVAQEKEESTDFQLAA